MLSALCLGDQILRVHGQVLARLEDIDKYVWNVQRRGVEMVICVSRDGRRSLVGSVRRCRGEGEGRAFFTAEEGHRIMKGCGFSVSSNLSTCTSSLSPITSVDRGKIAIDTR